MANNTVGTAYVQIVPSAKGIKGKIAELISGEAVSAGASAGESLGASMGSSIISKLGKLGIAAAVVKLVKDSVDAGSQLEQSFGGLETIYGDAADAAKQYAKEAYKSGISMNDYAESAVSMGAALKNAFGGNTTRAVESANMAIMDMADNAAKMGTPIESLNNAYQGFAKQNYTMLDNLKLGYGGTKQEMERLLRDAQALTGVKYDIGNLGDVYSAVHAIQTELGVTGTAAKEAETTISGSMAAMKASIQNVLASLSTGMDVSAPLTAVLDQINSFAMNNLNPALLNIVNAIPELLSAAPGIAAAGIDVGTQLIDGIAEAAPQVFRAAGDFIGKFIIAIVQKIPQLLETGNNIVVGLIEGIMEFIPALLENAGEIVKEISDSLTKSIPVLVKGVVKLLEGLLDHTPELIEALADLGPELVRGLVESMFDSIDILVDGLKDLITEGIDGIDPESMDGLARWGDAIIDSFKLVNPAIGNGIEFIVDNLPEIANFFSQIPGYASEAASKISEIFGNMVSSISGAFSSIGSSIAAAFESAVSAIKQTISNIIQAFKDTVQRFKDIGKNMVEGLTTGFKNAWESFTSTVTKLVNGVVGGVQKMLGIHSPSRVFKGIGEQVVAGFNLGVAGLGAGALDEVRSTMADINSMAGNKYTIAESIEETIATNGNNYGSYSYNDNGINRVTSLLEGMISNRGETRIVLEGDAKSIFNVVRTENTRLKTATGYHALA